ncbi:hypothetical protein [Sorangium sp. So ce128]|uniref:hypothetical protein n=1 Tax=Sorangium sp. So ce128 TaxID=3133281 RepID=UPI003F62DB2E
MGRSLIRRRIEENSAWRLSTAPPRRAGDGVSSTARYIEDGWTACYRVAGAKKVAREQVTFRLDAAGTKMTESGRKPTRHVQGCDELAACPYVDVLDAGRSRRVGEIFRDVRGARAR